MWLFRHPVVFFGSLMMLGSYDPNILAYVVGGLLVVLAIVPKLRRAAAEMFRAEG
jgi:hypothetical protein